MKRVFMLFCAFFAISGAVNAAPVPELLPADSPLIPPPIEAEFPVYHPIKVEPPQTPSDKEILDSVENLSSAAYLSVVRDWGLDVATADGLFTEQSEAVTYTQEQMGPLAAVPWVIGTVNATNDGPPTHPDAEPSIISVDRNGTVYTTTAFQMGCDK